MIMLIKDDLLREKAQRQHSYIRLLYKFRSKLVHELNDKGPGIAFFEGIPTVSSGTNKDGEPIWALDFPKEWLYSLAQETIFNFINECLHDEEWLNSFAPRGASDLNWYS